MGSRKSPSLSWEVATASPGHCQLTHHRQITKCVATKSQLFLQEAIPADSGQGGNRTRRALTLSLCALMVGADQAGILVLRVVDQVVKGQLPEELRVGPGVAVVRVLPIRLFSAVYEIGRNTAT